MKATELFRAKEVYGAGFVEIVIWQVPEPVPLSGHPYKYCLVYVVEGKRMAGYDNECGKGDHKHFGDREEPYRFVNPRQFMADVIPEKSIKTKKFIRPLETGKQDPSLHSG